MANVEPTAVMGAPDPFLHLRVMANTYESLQHTRIANSNRIHGAPVEIAAFDPILAATLHVEKLAEKQMRAAFRKAAPELHQWSKETVGLGPSLARLVGAIGDPLIAHPYYWEDDEDRVPDHHECGATCGRGRHLVSLPSYRRTPRQLLTYCGLGDAENKKRKGMSQDEALLLGKQTAKKAAWNLAQACIKTGKAPTADTTAEGVSAPSPTSDEPTPVALSRRSFGSSTSDHQPMASSTAESSTAGGHLLDDEPILASSAKVSSARRRSPYRDVYDDGRARYANRDWPPIRQKKAAERLVMKAILIDLWRVANGQDPKHPQT